MHDDGSIELDKNGLVYRIIYAVGFQNANPKNIPEKLYIYYIMGGDLYHRKVGHIIWWLE